LSLQPFALQALGRRPFAFVGAKLMPIHETSMTNRQESQVDTIFLDFHQKMALF
jgi:hypothetical protein